MKRILTTALLDLLTLVAAGALASLVIGAYLLMTFCLIGGSAYCWANLLAR